MVTQNFQIKDPYLELHDTESFLVTSKNLKKDPNFQDVILNQNSSDPYYHKNIFNLSQTYHHLDYIFHPSSSSTFTFTRPEITESYVQANPEGTKTFFPSFSRGTYVDVEEETRSFEELLLRKKDKEPNEEDIINNLMNVCRKEEEAIAELRIDISIRQNKLTGPNSPIDSFKNYFRNLCTWMITGALEDNMNNPVLTDDTGSLLVSTYKYEDIVQLDTIHKSIVSSVHVNTTTISNLQVLSKSFSNSMAEQRKKNTTDRYQQEIEEIQNEVKLEELKEQFRKQLVADRLQKDIQSRETAVNAVNIKNNMLKQSLMYNDVYVKNKKNMNIASITLVDLKKTEKEINDKFLDVLENDLKKIIDYKKNLTLFYTGINSSLDIFYTDFTRLFDDAQKFRDSGRESEIEIYMIILNKCHKDINDFLSEVLIMRKNISNYSLILRWYSLTKPTSLLFSTSIGNFGNGTINVAYTVPRNYIYLEYNTYDKDGNYAKQDVYAPVKEDPQKEEIYYFSIEEDEGEDLYDVSLEFTPIKRPADQTIELDIQIKKII